MPGRYWAYATPRNQRLNLDLYADPGQPVFFTLRASRALTPFGRPQLAAITVNCLLDQRTKSACQVEAYCVMPDHVHLVVTPAAFGRSVLVYVDRFKGWCSRELHRAGWVGVVWQPRSYDDVLRTEETTSRVAAYILDNPVRKGLCSQPEDYPWSGIPEPIRI